MCCFATKWPRIAPTPPPTSAPCAAPIAAAARGPSTISGPAPGTNRSALPASRPKSPPTQAPVAALGPAMSPVVTYPFNRVSLCRSLPITEMWSIGKPAAASRSTAACAESRSGKTPITARSSAPTGRLSAAGTSVPMVLNRSSAAGWWGVGFKVSVMIRLRALVDSSVAVLAPRRPRRDPSRTAGSSERAQQVPAGLTALAAGLGADPAGFVFRGVFPVFLVALAAGLDERAQHRLGHRTVVGGGPGQHPRRRRGHVGAVEGRTGGPTQVRRGRIRNTCVRARRTALRTVEALLDGDHQRVLV